MRTAFDIVLLSVKSEILASLENGIIFDIIFLVATGRRGDVNGWAILPAVSTVVDTAGRWARQSQKENFSL